MKKLFVTGLVLTLVLAVFLQPRAVQASTDGNNAASIMQGFGCALFDGNGQPFFTDDGRISVITSSGHTTLVCKATGVAPGPFNARGFFCGTFLGFTTDTHAHVSAHGEATLVCRI